MTHLWRAARPLVLASKSAARRGLLEAAGIPVIIEGAAVDERSIEAPLKARGSGGHEIAAQLAQAKAQAVSRSRPDDLVLGADQTLEFEGKVFSKPVDIAVAAAQLAAFSGRAHQLHSALCLMRGTRVVFEHVGMAQLTCRALSADFIATYLAAAGDKVLASVGAYQLEGLGIHLFERIDGDQATILGLPLLPLLDFLRREGCLAG
jgi:septum formation protein